MTETTCDAFLGGRVRLRQPAAGFRAGVDSVLLAAATPARAGETVLELGCGVGAAMLCLATRVPGLRVCGVEVQADYAALCRVNADENGIDARVFTADLRCLPADLTAQNFDHVIVNPPYFKAGSGKSSPLASRALAVAGATDLPDWIDAATRRLKPKGQLTLIQKADRLADVLRAMDGRLGSICVTPICGRAGRDADRFLLSARKGGRAAFRLRAPVHLHDGPRHEDDRPDYRAEIVSVLRNGAKFPDCD